MSGLSKMSWRRAALVLFATVLLTGIARFFISEPEIALMLGEPWEDMRQRSSASIAPAIPGHYWFRLPKSEARLRFIDPEYGFVTPQARFFTVSFESNGRVSSVRISPQVEPLLLDDTLEVVLDLQEQLSRGGWLPIRIKDNPPFADTPQWRAQLRDVNKGGTSYWHAGTKYQVRMAVHRFRDDRHPNEERYLIKLQLATPWTQP